MMLVVIRWEFFLICGWLASSPLCDDAPYVFRWVEPVHCGAKVLIVLDPHGVNVLCCVVLVDFFQGDQTWAPSILLHTLRMVDQTWNQWGPWLSLAVRLLTTLCEIFCPNCS